MFYILILYHIWKYACLSIVATTINDFIKLKQLNSRETWNGNKTNKRKLCAAEKAAAVA